MRRRIGRKDRELLSGIGAALGAAFGIAFLFYNAAYGILPGIAVGMFVFKKNKQRIREKRKNRMLLEFKGLAGAWDAALSAGYSMENAFLAAKRDMELLYASDREFLGELEQIKRKVEMRIPIDQAVYALGEKYGLEEVKDFAVVIQTAGRTGGNMIKIMRKTVENISMKIDTLQEIQVMVAAKKLEKNIMLVMPLLMILYLRIANRGYLDPLYGNVTGVLFMTVCLAFLLAADWLGERIVRIEV
jgi:tight adherence protein B